MNTSSGSVPEARSCRSSVPETV